MENVAKALTMSAGVLIGIMLLAVLVSFFNKGGSFNAEYDYQLDEQAIEEFNSKFTVYERDNLTYFDIISVANLAWDCNETCNWDATAGISVVLDGKGNVISKETGKDNFACYGESFYNNEFINDKFYKDGKLISFTSKLEYSTTTGKVNKITFTKN